MAQSEIILSGHLDYKLAQSLDSSRTKAILRTVMARPGRQRPNNWIHGQDWTYRTSCIGYHGLTRTLCRYRIRPSNQEGQFLCNRLNLSRILGWYRSFVRIWLTFSGFFVLITSSCPSTTAISNRVPGANTLGFTMASQARRAETRGIFLF